MKHQDSAYDDWAASGPSARQYAQQTRRKGGFRGNIDEHWDTNIHNPAFWLLVAANIYFVIAVAITLAGQAVAGMSQLSDATQKFISGWGFATFAMIVAVSVIVKVWSAAIRKPWDWHDALMPLAGLTILACVALVFASFGVGLLVIPFVVIPLFLMIALPTLLGYWLGKLISVPLTRRNAREARDAEAEWLPEPVITPEPHREPVRFVPPAVTASPTPEPQQPRPQPQAETPQPRGDTPMPRLPTMPKLPPLP